jgi:hypothetical protein
VNFRGRVGAAGDRAGLRGTRGRTRQSRGCGRVTNRTGPDLALFWDVGRVPLSGRHRSATEWCARGGPARGLALYFTTCLSTRLRKPRFKVSSTSRSGARCFTPHCVRRCKLGRRPMTSPLPWQGRCRCRPQLSRLTVATFATIATSLDACTRTCFATGSARCWPAAVPASMLQHRFLFSCVLTLLRGPHRPTPSAK